MQNQLQEGGEGGGRRERLRVSWCAHTLVPLAIPRKVCGEWRAEMRGRTCASSTCGWQTRSDRLFHSRCMETIHPLPLPPPRELISGMPGFLLLVDVVRDTCAGSLLRRLSHCSNTIVIVFWLLHSFGSISSGTRHARRSAIPISVTFARPSAASRARANHPRAPHHPPALPPVAPRQPGRPPHSRVPGLRRVRRLVRPRQRALSAVVETMGRRQHVTGRAGRTGAGSAAMMRTRSTRRPRLAPSPRSHSRALRASDVWRHVEWGGGVGGGGAGGGSVPAG